MAPLNIDLPDDVRTKVEQLAAEGGFASVEAYVESMLRADAAGGPALDDDDVEALLNARRNGPWVDVDDADLRQMREKFQLRLDQIDPERRP
jgi:hypothetical protein